MSEYGPSIGARHSESPGRSADREQPESLSSHALDSHALNSLARSAYLHIPFCVHRCGYCNFTVVAGREDLVDRFLDALELELAALRYPRPVDTLFWGGGTPTYLNAAQLERLITLCRYWLPLASDGEWSCEANPLDGTTVKLQQLQQAGVNRLSVGGQSFADAKLRCLERDHTGQQLTDMLQRAQHYFASLSLDLIFAAPGESLSQWEEDLACTLEHHLDHVSTYGLTIEKGSAFFARQLHGQLSSVGEETELAMYRLAIEKLVGAGLEHYEVSNFARPGHACRHNEAYWTGRPWLAFGPGAAGFDGQQRTVNHRSVHTYIKRLLSGCSPVAECETLSAEQQLRERFVFGLRRLAGVDMHELVSSDYPEPERLFQPHLERALASGWLERNGSRVRLTAEGLVVSDMLWPDFL